MSNDKKSPEEELELLVPTEFPPDEFPDPAQTPEDLGNEEDV